MKSLQPRKETRQRQSRRGNLLMKSGQKKMTSSSKLPPRSAREPRTLKVFPAEKHDVIDPVLFDQNWMGWAVYTKHRQLNPDIRLALKSCYPGLARFS